MQVKSLEDNFIYSTSLPETEGGYFSGVSIGSANFFVDGPMTRLMILVAVEGHFTRPTAKQFFGLGLA